MRQEASALRPVRCARRWRCISRRRSTRLPPPPPFGGNPLQVMLWSLQMRFWAWVHAEFDGPKPHVRMFVLYHDPGSQSQRVSHSLGLQKGLIGVVNAFASDASGGGEQRRHRPRAAAHRRRDRQIRSGHQRAGVSRTATPSRSASRCCRSAMPKSWPGAFPSTATTRPTMPGLASTHVLIGDQDRARDQLGRR